MCYSVTIRTLSKLDKHQRIFALFLGGQIIECQNISKNRPILKNISSTPIIGFDHARIRSSDHWLLRPLHQLRHILRGAKSFYGPFPASFFFIFVFSIQLAVNVQYKFLPMTGFEPWTSGIRSNLSTN